jgi:hypothetical protein
MTSRITDLESLRKELRAMSRGDLLIIAERAIELVPRATLQALVGDYVHVEDGLVRSERDTKRLARRSAEVPRR